MIYSAQSFTRDHLSFWLALVGLLDSWRDGQLDSWICRAGSSCCGAQNVLTLGMEPGPILTTATDHASVLEPILCFYTNFIWHLMSDLRVVIVRVHKPTAASHWNVCGQVLMS